MAFKFIPGPDGAALTDEQLLASSLHQAADKQEHANDQMFWTGAVIIAVVVLAAVALFVKRMIRA